METKAQRADYVASIVNNDSEITSEQEIPKLKETRHYSREALDSFVHNFILCYGARTLLSVILRLFSLRSRPSEIFSLSSVFSEKNLIVREEAIRLGLFVGGSTGGYTFLKGLLQSLFPQPKEKRGWQSLVAGGAIGLALRFQPKANQRTIVLYLLARLAQSAYNACKSRGYWHFWGSDWAHGDSLLFILSSAQIMYAYVMRPETLPASYYNFIVRTGPIPEPTLAMVRINARGLPLPDLPGFLKYLKSRAPSGIPHHPPISSDLPPILGCNVLHPQNPTCTAQIIDTAVTSSRRIAPVYGSLTLISLLVFSWRKLLRQPIKSLQTALFGTVQSTSFLAAFVTLYMSVICAHRKLFTTDHRFIYFFAGLIASTSIFIEKKSRRSELALYALPRALDSAFLQLVDRKWLPSIPHGETLLFCITMAGLMYFYEHEPATMSPYLLNIFNYLFKAKKLVF